MLNEMTINSEQIRALRDVRGWSQEHLAEASGLSLRTIQRVESEGRASRETRLNLAAAFDVPLARLSAIDNTQSESLKAGDFGYPIYIGIGTLFILIGLLMNLEPAILVAGAAMLVTGLVLYALDSILNMRRAAGLGTHAISPLIYVGIVMLSLSSTILVLGYIATGEFRWLQASIFAAVGLFNFLVPKMLGWMGVGLDKPERTGKTDSV